MHSTPVIEAPHTPAPTASFPTTPRCLELQPVRDRLGLGPIVIGVGRVVVGSASTAEAHVPVEGVAARHAEIDFDGRQPRVKVLSPLTWLNDGPVREAILRDGDVLTLGPVEFRIQIVNVPAPPPLPVPELPPPAPVAAASVPDVVPPVAPVASTGPAPAAPATVSPTKESADPAKPRSRVARVQREWLEKRRNGVVRREQPAVTKSVQPLLDEAEAARNLKQDLERVEREAAWYQASLPAQPLVAPPEVRPEPVLEPVVDPLAEREQALQHQAAQLTQQAEEMSRQQLQLQSEQAQLATASKQLLSERAAVTAQAASLESERAAVRAEREPLQSTTEQVRQQYVALQQDREQLQGLQQKLAADRDELFTREQRLLEQQGEFDSAVAALDLDREGVRRERETVALELTQARQRLDGLKTELSTREQRLTEQQDELHRQAAELETKELALEEQRREGAARLREREMELSRRETGLRQRESSLNTQLAEIEARRAQCEQAARQLAVDRSQLESDRDELTRARQECERQRRELQADRERVRGQSQSLTAQAERAAAEWERLQAAHSELDAERTQLAEQSRELARRHVEVSTQVQSLTAPIGAPTPANEAAEADRLAKERQLAELQHNLEQEQQRLAEWERELNALQSELEQQADVAAALPTPAVVESQPAEITVREHELAEQQQALEAAVAELEQYRDDIARQWEELEARAAELEARQAGPAATPSMDGVGGDSAVVADLQAAVATLTADRDRLLAQLTEFDAVQTEWNEQYDALTQRIAELESREAEVQAREQRLAEQATAKTTSGAEAELGALRDMVDALTADRDRLQASLDGVAYRPQSWETERVLPPAQVADACEEVERSLPSGAYESHSEYAEEEVPQDPAPSFEETDTNAYDGPTAVPVAASERPTGGSGSLLDSLFRRPMPSELESTRREFAAEESADAYVDEPTPPVGQEHELREDVRPVERPAPAAAPAAGGIRSQLAMLFGISSNELEATAARHAHDDEVCVDHQAEKSAVEAERRLASEVRAAAVVPPTPIAPPVPMPAVEPENDEEVQDDSVAAYMQRLLKKSALTNPTPAVAPAAEPSAQSTSGERDATEMRNTADEDAENDDASGDDDSSAKARSGRRMDKEEIAEMRASIDSMRQIANLSARSAVARHYAKKLDVTFKVKQALTAVAGGLSALLLTAELWTSNSYRMPGICSGIVAIIAGIETARTAIQMRRVKQIAGMKSESDDEAAAKDRTELPA